MNPAWAQRPIQFSVDYFDDHHRCSVAQSRALVDDSRVSAWPLGKPRHQVREQPLHHLWFGDLLTALATRGDMAVIAGGDTTLDTTPHLTTTRLGRDEPYA